MYVAPCLSIRPLIFFFPWMLIIKEKRKSILDYVCLFVRSLFAFWEWQTRGRWHSENFLIYASPCLSIRPQGSSCRGCRVGRRWDNETIFTYNMGYPLNKNEHQKNTTNCKIFFTNKLRSVLDIDLIYCSCVYETRKYIKVNVFFIDWLLTLTINEKII